MIIRLVCVSTLHSLVTASLSTFEIIPSPPLHSLVTEMLGTDLSTFWRLPLLQIQTALQKPSFSSSKNMSLFLLFGSELESGKSQTITICALSHAFHKSPTEISITVCGHTHQTCIWNDPIMHKQISNLSTFD